MTRAERRGIREIYSGQPVWCQDRHESGQTGAGIVFGSIWDTDNNGVVIQFPQGRFFARFFIKEEELCKYWNKENKRFEISSTVIKLLGLVDDFPPQRMKCPPRAWTLTQPRAFCTRNKRSVPIWTEYYT